MDGDQPLRSWKIYIFFSLFLYNLLLASVSLLSSTSTSPGMFGRKSKAQVRRVRGWRNSSGRFQSYVSSKRKLRRKSYGYPIKVSSVIRLLHYNLDKLSDVHGQTRCRSFLLDLEGGRRRQRRDLLRNCGIAFDSLDQPYGRVPSCLK